MIADRESIRAKERDKNLRTILKTRTVAQKIGAVWRCPVKTDLTRKFQLSRLNFEPNIEF
jgi:hypothetical protein